VSCDFFLRAKAIIVSSRLGENVVVTSKFQQFPVVAQGGKMQVSKVMFFDRRDVDMVAIGLRSGVGVIKKADSLIGPKEEARVIPDNYPQKGAEQHEDKVTFIGMVSTPTRVVFGSKSGYLTFFSLSACPTFYEAGKKEEEQVSFQIQSSTMTRIVQVMELPSQVKDAKKHIYYVLQ
jgi:hypothetical protein